MKPKKQSCDLKTCLLCKLCIREWLPAIASNKKNFQVKKGEVLFREGDEMAGIFFVYNGSVKVHKHWGDDKELILRFAKDGHIIGHRGLGEDFHFPVSATALETTTVCFFEKDFFFSSLKTNHDFLFQLLIFFATELKESEKNMRNLVHMPVKKRIAQALLTLKEKFGLDTENAINLPLSRHDLASYVGTSYETLFRMLNEMSEEGAVEVNSRKILIVSERKLSKMLE